MKRELYRITKEKAIAQGMSVIAGPYSQGETWMLENCVAALAGVDFGLVQVVGGDEVWRKGCTTIKRNNSKKIIK